MSVSPSLRRVGRYWAAMQARDWGFARAQLAPEAACNWWATGERFVGAEALIRVNADYPEGWTIFLLDLQQLGDGRVLSLVRVEQDARCFWANSFFQLAEAGILAIDEYWSDQAEPPAWRCGLSLPLGADLRPGLSLELGAWA